MKILFIGDIVGRLGRITTKKLLPNISKSDNIGAILANGENLASGRGATAKTINEVRGFGVNYFTSGEHIFKHKGFEEEIDSQPILRPENFPEGSAGSGCAIVKLPKNKKILLINLIGRTFMKGSQTSRKGGENYQNPFKVVEEVLKKYRKDKIPKIVDFHAEATSEKIALGHFLDGRVTAVLGTHTHVPTADARILSKGTAFVTDIGMVGSLNSVIGVKKEIIMDRFLGNSRDAFEWQKKGPAVFNSVLIEVDEKEGKAKSIKRVDKVVE